MWKKKREDKIKWEIEVSLKEGEKCRSIKISQVFPYPVSPLDGKTNTYGWASWTKPTSPENPSFIEMKFLTFVPEFKSLKIYSATIEDMGVYIWKKGDWQKIGEVKDNKEDVIEFKFDEKIRTVKMKILITKVKPGTKAEIYEIELYN